MTKYYIYDFDLIGEVGEGTPEDPYRPALVDHSFLTINSWKVLPDDDGLELDIVSGEDRIAKRYRDALLTSRLDRQPKVRKFNEKIQERKNAKQEERRRIINEIRENLSETEGELQRNPRRGLRRSE